ncbi:MAG: hypothetical protein K2I04_01445, partial [Muribaculaceae bacterium]|nr:hypothetical protein [Muribaculaceae bacterium]
IEGYGFESDQGMVSYSVNRPTAILPADRTPGSARNRAQVAPDSTPAPTENAAPAAPARTKQARTAKAAIEAPAPQKADTVKGPRFERLKPSTMSQMKTSH